MAKAQINDIEIYYEVHGQGYPLVLVPGFTGDHLNWGGILPFLPEQYQVIIFDNRGVGFSSAPDENYSMEMMADDVFGLMEHLGIEKAHIVGQSMGAVIAQVMALKHPERIEKLVLGGTVHKLNENSSYALHTFKKAFENGMSYPDVVELFFPWIFSDTFLKDKETINGMLQLVCESPCPMSIVGFKRQLKAYCAYDGKGISKIQNPTLVVVFEKDHLTLPEQGKAVAEEIPNAKIHIIEGSGHAGIFEIPDAFAQAVLSVF